MTCSKVYFKFRIRRVALFQSKLNIGFLLPLAFKVMPLYLPYERFIIICMLQIHFWMYEVQPTIIESRLLGSNNIVDAAVVGIPNKENGEVTISCQTT